MPVVDISLSRLKIQFPKARFLVVSPTPDVFSKLSGGCVRIAADNEFSLIKKVELADLLSQSKRHLVGWYYQQFLKFAVVASTREASVLVLDADTVVLRDIQSEPNVFFTSKERHEVYFEHFQALFHATAPFKASAITNFMWFNPDSLRAMLLEISERHHNVWWKVIVDIANDISADGAFSEYETYANWFSLRHGPHTEIPIHIFRRGDLLIGSAADYPRVIAEVEAQGYDAVAFELNHSGGLLRRIGAWVLLNLAIKQW
jgi:hypothetical protein